MSPRLRRKVTANPKTVREMAMEVLPARFSGAVISWRIKLVKALPLLLAAIFLTMAVSVCEFLVPRKEKRGGGGG